MPHDPSPSPVAAICGGRIIDPSSSTRSGAFNLFIQNGRVAEVSCRQAAAEEKAIDARGLIVTPGFIDLHTHLREPGFEFKEDIGSGSRAAVAGGFTTILCMPNTNPASDSVQVARAIQKRAEETGLVRILPVAAMSIGLAGRELSDMAALAKEGVRAVSDDGNCIQDRGLMRDAMAMAKTLNLLVIDHPEDVSSSRDGIINEGRVSREMGVKGIPREAENAMIERDIALAEETGARLHIAHISTAEGVDLLREAKGRGLAVTAEVTPHHLLLTEDDVGRLGTRAKMKPPLRTEADRQALLRAAADGTIDAIATDHAPHGNQQQGDLASAPFGVIGMESAFAACLQLVATGAIGLERLIELFTSGPARAAGLRAGTLAAGAPADITLFDPDEEWTIDAKQFFSKSRNNPFDGLRVRGRVRWTIVGGKLVYKK